MRTTRRAASPPASATGPTTSTPPRFYEPVARGLEIRIGERLEELRRLERGGRGHEVAEADCSVPHQARP